MAKMLLGSPHGKTAKQSSPSLDFLVEASISGCEGMYGRKQNEAEVEGV